LTDLEALAHRSHRVITSNQVPSGAYPASPTFSAYRGYCWFRDGAFIAEGVSRYGDAASAGAFHTWCAQVLAERTGQVDGLIARADANFAVIDRFVKNSGWLAHLAEVPATRSNTSVCLSIMDEAVAKLDDEAKAAFAKGLVSRLDKEGVAYDIGHYRDAPPGLRIWAGATVETSDLEALMPWLDWAFQEQKAALQAAA
jgi:hypothetical protein